MRLALSLFMISSLVSELAFAAGIASFTPQGSNKKTSQIQARFDTDMVDFGNGRTPSPFKVDCPARGAGRWLDARTFVHDFVGELPRGIRCTFTLVQAKNLQGEALGGTKVFSFDTGGPALIRSMPYENSTYVNEEDPLLLIFDSAIKSESLVGHLLFQVPQRADAIGFVQLPDAEKYLQEHWPYLLEELKAEPKFYLLVKPKERLSADSDITLLIDKGITSPDGVPTATAQTLHFKTRPAFRASFYCQREKAGAPCTPHDDFTLTFNAPLAEKDRARIRVLDAKNKKLEIEREGAYFSIPGPHPADSSYKIEVPADVTDERGRPLANAKEFPLTIRVGAYGPLIKFPGDFGVLEASLPTWPLHMRKVESDLHGKLYKVESRPDSVLKWYKTIKGAGDYSKRATSIFSGLSPSDFKDVPLKKPNGSDAFEVFGVPLAGPGFYLMEVGSEKLGAALLDAKKPMFARASVLVTNLAVHVKKGRQSTLVWVTNFDKGQPVPAADITISDCKGKVLLTGKTDTSGLFIQKSALPRSHGSCYGSDDYEGESSDYLVSASKDGDFSFTLTHWNTGIESWRFQLPWDSESTDFEVHSILDRTLFRVGETVSMLHVARQRVPDGLNFPSSQKLKNTINLQHIGSDKHYKLPVVWDDKKGRADSQWKIPADAPLGWYEIMIGDHESARFRVDEFRLATMRGRLQAHENSLIAPKNIAYDFDVNYLSGGPASKLPVRLRRSIQGPAQLRFSGYDEFDFETGPIDREPGQAKQQESKIETKDVALDKAGTGTASWPAPTIDRPTQVLAEMEFPDANGEARTVASEHRIWPAALVIGMKSPYWLQKGEKLNLSGVTLTPQGQLVANQELIVRAFKEDILSHRRRGVGGTYVYEHKTEIKEIGVFCEARSDNKGLWNCQKPLADSGTILLQVEGKDKDGHLSLSRRSIWVAGERLWFMSDDHDRIDLIPEKRHYEAGETAKIQVKMPFPQATLLMATERDGGILEAKVISLDSKQPFIEVPIKRGYAPNIFVSAWAVRGRVKGTEPLLKVDLGKPAHKLGITELKVGWRQHTLNVKVTADKAVYKVREKAQARIEIKAPDGQSLPADAIATIAVVDEALLELMGNKTWDILPAMMSERAYGIEHATSSMQVIGKRHFGLKALPQGGGGGSNPTRELFDSLIFWKARVPLTNGVATIDFPLTDSLSSFRIVAVAQAGTDMFGMDSTAIQTQQDISLIGGLPPLVRAGDHWQALVTVRNRSKNPQLVKVKARMEDTELPEKSLNLKAEESQLVSWDLDVPEGVSELKYTFDAQTEGGGQDSLRFVQQVRPAVPLRVLQATLIVLNGEAQKIPVALPENADPHRGGIDLSFGAGPGPDMLQGTRVFFQEYPYSCLEQGLSSAVGLDSRKAWDQIVRDLDSYRDSDGLLKYFPLMHDGSMTLTAYFLSLSHEAGLTLPKSKEESLRAALKRVVEGQSVDHEYLMPGDQLIYRKIMALEALTRFESADAALIKNFDVQAELLPHATLIDLVQTLSRYQGDGSLNALQEKAVQQLQARLRLAGTQYGLAGEEYNQISSLLSSPDSNAARLLILGLQQNLWPSDQARMLEGLLHRQKKGAWSTTVANAWGTLAFKRYLKVHPPAGSDSKVSVVWQDKTQSVGLKDKEPTHLAWPKKRETLTLNREGTGEVWTTALSRAAVPLREPFQAGYRLEKTLQPVEQKIKGKWSRGDIVKVSFAMEAGSDQTWVVLADPIPAGARILNASLRDDSGQDASKFLNPVYVERRHEGYFAYFDFMPAGKHSIAYVIQVNNPGLFQMSSTRLEAMYAPDQYAEIPNAPVQVD